jgi:hypothetical protein
VASKSDKSTGIDRRGLLRTGALLLGGAGVATVANAPDANAATGEPAILGESNTEDATTTITVSPGEAPALALMNTNGPQLNLATVDDSWDGSVKVGDIVNTGDGLVMGIDFGMGVMPTPLLTPRDIDTVVSTLDPLFPQRVLDTRTKAGRAAIVRKSSADALTSAGKLRAGHWIDIGIDPVNEAYDAQGWMFNVTVVDPDGSGHMSVYGESTEPPTTSTVNFQKGVNIANGGFAAASNDGKVFFARLYTSQDTHLLWDTTGVFTITIDESNNARSAALRAARREGVAALNKARQAARKSAD